jgi:hypothetical protein
MGLKNKKNNVAFPFVLDLLTSADYLVKPMFGCHALYIDEKIMIIMRKKDDHQDANGVWIATEFEHHPSLKKIFPALKSVYILSDGKAETAWQMLPDDSDDFEESVTTLCDLILKGDKRIGRIPNRKKSKKK